MIMPVLTKSPRKSRVRARILAGALDLFYRDGFNVTGVDTVSAICRVSKTSLYRLFESKDDLITAVIAEQDKRFWDWWDGVVQALPNAPRTQLTALLAGIGGKIEQAEFRGCPFLNLASEITDSHHPARGVAKANKERMLGEIELLLRNIGAATPERTAAQILLLINGAYASRMVGGIPDIRSHLVDAAMKLVAP
jgi:AcrR family transcriptional regulator